SVEGMGRGLHLTGHNSSIEKMTENQGVICRRERPQKGTRITKEFDGFVAFVPLCGYFPFSPEESTAGIGSSLRCSTTACMTSRRIVSSTSGFCARRSAAFRTEPWYITSNSVSYEGKRHVWGTCVTTGLMKPASARTRF